MLLERLARQLEAEGAEVAPSFLAQIFLLYAALENPNSPRIPTLATTIAAIGMASFLRTFGLAAEEQAKYLRSLPPTRLEELSQNSAYAFGVLMRSRVVTVLSKPQTEAQLAAYSRTLADVSVTFGCRAGFETLGEAAGAKRKQFVRFKRVREGRAHSALEGSVRFVNENWLIDGYSVPTPAHPSLPLSSRLWCGHGALYLP